jgi:hypothetical protein
MSHLLWNVTVATRADVCLECLVGLHALHLYVAVQAVPNTGLFLALWFRCHASVIRQTPTPQVAPLQLAQIQQ